MTRLLTACLFLAAACNKQSVDASALAGRCSNCDITLVRVGQLSDEFEPGALPDEMIYAVRDSSGRVFTVARKKDAVLVFGRDGALIRRLGQFGEGPGEFRTVRRVLIGAGDSVFVSDWGLNRLTVYGPDLSFVRTQSLKYWPSLVLRDGSFVIAGQVYTAELIGFPLHVVGADGVLLRSFGIDTPEFSPDSRMATERLAAKAKNGDIWSVAPGRYTLERWDPKNGQRKQSIPIKSSWFKEIATFPEDERVRPPAVIEALWEDGSGLIWVLFRDADLDWKAPALANVDRTATMEEYEHTYDWILEVVDPASESVIASKRYRNILWGRPPSTVLVSANGSTNGVGARYDVWQPTLIPRGSK